MWGSGIPRQDAQTDEKWPHSSARRVENNHSYVGLGPLGSRQSRTWLHNNNSPSPLTPPPALLSFLEPPGLWVPRRQK